MIKLKLSGTKTQLARMLKILSTCTEIIDRTEPIQNSHSNLYRIYISVQDIEPEMIVAALRGNENNV